MRLTIGIIVAILVTLLLGCGDENGLELMEHSDIRITELVFEKTTVSPGVYEPYDLYMVVKNFSSVPGTIVVWRVNFKHTVPYDQTIFPDYNLGYSKISPVVGSYEEVKINLTRDSANSGVTPTSEMLKAGLLIEMLVKESDGRTYYTVYYDVPYGILVKPSL